MQYTGNLADLIATVEKEFSAQLAKSEGANSAASLSKAEDEKKDKKPSDSKPPSEGKDKAPAADAKPPEAEDASDALAEEGQDGAAPAPAAAAPGAPALDAQAAGHGYDDEDMEHMRQMYASMSREELMAHHDAIRDALDAASAAPAAPDAAAPGAPAPGMDKCGPGMMGKSEKKAHSELKDENPELNSKPKAGGTNLDSDPKNGGIEGAQPSGPKGARSPASTDSKNLKDAMSKTERAERNGGKITATGEPKNPPGAKSDASKDQRNLSDMEKSENIGNDLQKSLEAAEAKNTELKKSLDAVQEFLTKLVTKVAAPKGKAITEIAALNKNEDGGSSVDTNSMSKSEITQKLLAKSQDPKTSAVDRAAINAYYLSNANVQTISHLLK